MRCVSPSRRLSDMLPGRIIPAIQDVLLIYCCRPHTKRVLGVGLGNEALDISCVSLQRYRAEKVLGADIGNKAADIVHACAQEFLVCFPCSGLILSVLRHTGQPQAEH
eukprot:363618-Chlamydomonas_euryale.AAC.12